MGRESGEAARFFNGEIFMSVILLLVVILAGQLESMTVRLYGRKNKEGGMFFNAIICAFAALFFLITDKNGLCFPKELFIYSLVGVSATATGFYAAYLAYKYGSFIVTNLIASFSSVMVITYGLAFLKEPINIFGYMGIAMFFVSSILVNLKGNDGNEKKPFSVKWLVCAILTAVSNGVLGIVMRSQQIKFNGAYDNEYMILNSVGAAILLAVIGLITERDKIGSIIKKGFFYGAITGGLNGFKNLITFVIYLYIPIAVFTPLRAGLSFVTGFLISVIFYKEKFTKLQLLGILFGVLSVVMFALR